VIAELVVRRPHELGDERADAAVVMDVFRATTTAAVLAERFGDLRLVADPAGLAALAGQRISLFSELAVDGHEKFDNSPALARDASPTGIPVLVTTNGTGAVAAAAKVAERVALAAFINFGAVRRWIEAVAPRRLLIVPAGILRKQAPVFEDDLCASALHAELSGRPIPPAELVALCRHSRVALGRMTSNPELRADLDMALDVSSVDAVPEVSGTTDGVIALRRADVP
jgi:phosphosulfolactate phosphohydrolase-like enzyme